MAASPANSPMGVVLFGYGNPSRGDDALGPLLLERAEDWAGRHQELRVQAVTDFQLQIEHALDLQGCDLALFMDADVACDKAFSLCRVAPDQDATYTTHELSPAAVLQVYRTVEGREPPPAYILSLHGERFDLGQPLSPAAVRSLDAAWILLKELLSDGRPEAWDERLDTHILAKPGS